MPRAYNPAVRRAGVPSAPTATSTFLGSVRANRIALETGYENGAGSIPKPSVLPRPRLQMQRRQNSSGSDTAPAASVASGPAVATPSGQTGNSGPSGTSSGSSGTTGATSQESGSSQGGSSGATSNTSDTTSSDGQTSSSISTSSSSTTTTSTTTTSTDTSTTSSTTSSSISSPTSTPPTSSSDSSTSSPSSTPPSATSPTPFATSASPTSTTSSSSSSGIFTTIYSTIVTDINGQPTTLVTAIPTTLPYPSDSGSSGSSKRAIITGSAIGGTVFLIIIVALTIFVRRSDKLRMNYKKLRVFGRGRRRLLEEDDDDDWMHDVGMTTATTQYRDYPASVASSARPFGLHARGPSGSALSALSSNPPTPMQDLHPPQASSPYIMGRRAASSGSIFHEAVWPPPSEANRFVDPLVDSASRVDLSNVVRDVMGPSPTPSYDAQYTRAPSQAALLPSTPGSPTTRGPPPPSRVQPSHSLKHSWELAKEQQPDPALYDLDRELGAGSPLPEPSPPRLYVRNAEPLSPGSPLADSSGGSPGGTPRWIERQIRKESVIGEAL